MFFSDASVTSTGCCMVRVQHHVAPKEHGDCKKLQAETKREEMRRRTLSVQTRFDAGGGGILSLNTSEQNNYELTYLLQSASQ